MRNVTVAAVQMKCSKVWRKILPMQRNWCVRQQQRELRLFFCRSFLNGPISARSADMSIMNMRRLQRKPCSASFQQGSGRVGDCDSGQLL